MKISKLILKTKRFSCKKELEHNNLDVHLALILNRRINYRKKKLVFFFNNFKYYHNFTCKIRFQKTYLYKIK